MKETAVVICPGRGTYNKEDLGYLTRHHFKSHYKNHHNSNRSEFIHAMDSYRRDHQQMQVSELDGAEHYRMALHSAGDNASALIYTCALADFLSIDRERYDIVAVTGNSMGWYLALACAGALDLNNGMHVVNTMGSMMHTHAEGGQVIYPLCNDQWQYDEALAETVRTTVAKLQQNPAITISTSITLGNMIVLAANAWGVTQLLEKLPKVQERYPFALPNHGAFHSPLMTPISRQAINLLPANLFAQPTIPLIDGRGHIWQTRATDIKALHAYTFDKQVCQTYNFTAALEVAAKEFAPDRFIILGPGSTLGAPVAQQLINMRWQGMRSKEDFKSLQATDPFVLGMGDRRQGAEGQRTENRGQGTGKDNTGMGA
ncbi:MAG: [acyl-carrier-protein] S-malonyltransferase [Lentisphaeria bacterium]